MNANPRIIVAALTLSAATLVGIATSEGYRDTAYIPIPGDVPTVGYGETQGVRMGQKTTPDRALVQLLASADKYAQGVKSCVTVPLYSYEFDAYVQFSYNVGVGAFCGSTLVKKLNAGDYVGACNELARWTRSGGRVVQGLVNRRAAERKLCLGQT